MTNQTAAQNSNVAAPGPSADSHSQPASDAPEALQMLTPDGIVFAPVDTAFPSAPVLIAKPEAGQTVEFPLETGTRYDFDFRADDIQTFSQDGDVLTIMFPDGAVLILPHFGTVATGDSRSILVFHDHGQIPAEGPQPEVVAPDAVVDTTPDENELEAPQSEIRETPADQDAAAQEIEAALSDIQPASGETSTQTLAQIEPQAGDDTQGQVENSGFTFENPSITPVGPLSAVGPINPTALQYGVEFFNDEQFPADEEPPETPGTPDDHPILTGPVSHALDETNLGPIVQKGQIIADFGHDGPGTIAPNGLFSPSGSLAGGTLTSGGVPVTVTSTPTGYVGAAGPTPVFYLVFDPATGDYIFTLTGVLDHADGADPNDAITLQFGVTATDADGDTAHTSVNITVADDAPAAIAPDSNTIDEKALTTGPIVINDALNVDFGHDGAGSIGPDGTNSFSGVPSLTSGGRPVTITQTADGYVGTLPGGAVVFELHISAPAAPGIPTAPYSFTQHLPLDHDPSGSNTISLDFGIVLQDFDGDSTATTITVNITDSVPHIGDKPVVGAGIENIDESNLPGGSAAGGSVNVDFGADTPGAITPDGTATASGSIAGGTLTSGGQPVTITPTANGYEGTLPGGAVIFTLTIDPANGDYNFVQTLPLDHADGANPDDVITLQFGVTASDSDGDTDSGVITINIADDAPVAADDGNSVPEKVTTVTGNVLTNDDAGEDTPAALTQIGFGTVVLNVVPGTPSVINGQYGTLTIHSDGSYSYTINGTNTGAVQDDFIYTLTDFDGDSDTAHLKIDVAAPDDKPDLAKPAPLTVDETDIDGAAPPGSDSDSDTLVANFGNDGPGTFDVSGAGTFTFSGAKGGVLTSHGLAVTVSTSGNSYVGTDTNGFVVFRLDLNQQTGQYTFTQFGALDHADDTDPNDVITLNFGVTAKDTDGDIATDDIVVQVLDDGPQIDSKSGAVDEDALDHGPIVVTRSMVYDFGEDGPGDIHPTGNFSALFQAGGPNQILTSGGQAVTVVATANGYIGTINGGATTIFTLTVNPANGQHTYTQFQAIDHPDGSNPDDVIWLKFEVEIVDHDGDTDTAMIVLDVHDGGPVAVDDCVTFRVEDGSVSGNVTVNDDPSNDLPNTVTQIAFGAHSVTVPATGSTTIDGNFGTLEIFADGSYTYTLNPTLPTPTPTRLALAPTEADVAGISDTLTKNGITIKGTNSNNNDLTWVSTPDGSGVGIAGGDSAKAWPSGETFEISFAAARIVHIDISDIGENNIDDGLDFTIHFTDGSTQPFEFDIGSVTVVNGLVTVSFDSADYGGKLIEQVDVTSVANSHLGVASFLLSVVEVIPAHPEVTDTHDAFVYTYTDGDGDSDTAVLALKGYVPLFIVGTNADDTDPSTTPYEVGNGEGTIPGGHANDILVGDVGGATLEGQTKDYNVVLILDVSGSMGSSHQAGTKLSLLIDATEHLLQDLGAYSTGNVKVHIVPFSTNTVTSGTFTVTDAGELASALNFLHNMPEGGYTNYEAALQNSITWLQGGGPIAGAETFTYFISDGEPNYYLDNSGQVVHNTNVATAMNQITGSDGTDEVASIQALSDEVIGIGINIGSGITRLDVIDSDGQALNIDDPNDLDASLTALSPLNKLAAVGGDTITGGDDADYIFGDALNTDALAADQGLGTPTGAGWKVFEQLESGPGWDRQDTIDYIKTHAEELGGETVNAAGDTRSGGDDVLDGGAGDDVIFGQEGDDVITGGGGDDTLYGGSGSDAFLFESVADGVDTIKDFNPSEDVLDVSALLQGYDALQDSINDFVFATEVGGNTEISVDVDGSAGGATAVKIAVLEAVTGLTDLDIETITNNGETTL